MTRAEPPPPDGARVALAWLGHPVTVLALVVLVLNDHLLKDARPGPVTGKLSDVAGLVLAPPLVAVLVTLVAPRLPARAAAGVALGSVGLGFTLVKSSGYAAAVASDLWSAVSGPSLIRADLTDLLTLPALVLAAWVRGRARRDPVGRRAVRAVRLLVLLPAATLAVAATGPVGYPDAVTTTVVGGRLAAGATDTPAGAADGDPWLWRISDDAGTRWRAAAEAEEAALYRRPERTARIGDRVCSTASPQRCYRLRPGAIRVEESDDGGRTWRLSWQVTDEQRELLRARYPESGPNGERVAGQDLTVLDVAGGQHVVLVANGRDGFAVRDADGGWRRIGFAGGRWGAEPPPLGVISPADRHNDPLRAMLLAVALSVLVLAVSGVRAGRASGRGSPEAILQTAILAVAAMFLLGVWFTDDLILPVLVLGSAVLLLGSTLLALIPRRSREVPGGWFAEVVAAAVLTLTLAGVTLASWLHGRPVYASTAVTLAVLGTVPGLLLGWRAARLIEPWRPPVEPPYPPSVAVDRL
ncbi:MULTISPECIES: hypothetical protein [unclassified Micromonospora]|uniref:hypothetical protein n=1 Tax=unclassified Micromonospora TaxID=2617518 RepID=UPI001C243CC7|nr:MULTISPECIES: hypothetical protein [unclassified Micromonospora]MBU8858890.1 hypothetical protein [Micromonospora sp. WMMB482]MDM4778390.1 hypothetical protein [Micromonospora sp. b486]